MLNPGILACTPWALLESRVKSTHAAKFKKLGKGTKEMKKNILRILSATECKPAQTYFCGEVQLVVIPARQFSNVVLPAPQPPKKATISPVFPQPDT